MAVHPSPRWLVGLCGNFQLTEREKGEQPIGTQHLDHLSLKRSNKAAQQPRATKSRKRNLFAPLSGGVSVPLNFEMYNISFYETH